MPHSDHLVHYNQSIKKRLSLFDRLVIIVSIIYPLSAFPQALQVFAGNTDGVSSLSWISFSACATLFLIYGVKHRVLPMVISNFLWVIMDSAVIIGLFVGR